MVNLTPFGLKTSPSSFRYALSLVIGDLPYCHYFMDNIHVGGSAKGVWLLCPLANFPPDGWSSMDEPLFVLSRQWFVHCNNLSPACKRHPTDPVVRTLDHLRPTTCNHAQIDSIQHGGLIDPKCKIFENLLKIITALGHL